MGFSVLHKTENHTDFFQLELAKMRVHLDRKLQYVAKPDTELYRWAINEIGKDGKVLVSDQIPWGWSLYFTATEVTLSSGFTVKEARQEETDPWPGRLKQEAETTHEHVIRAKLQPGDPRSANSVRSRGQTNYRMFGTDRLISDFTLNITRLQTEDGIESCIVYGHASYTSKDDFEGEETVEDNISFYLMVRPSTFDHYAARIAAGTADEIILRVERVSGFYSDWSPDIFTSDVKILTRSVDDQKLQVPTGLKHQPPRLGNIGEVNLLMNARREQSVKTTDGYDFAGIDGENQREPADGSNRANSSNGTAPQLFMPLRSPQQSNTITYRLGWAIWWLTLAIGAPALLLCGWGIANYLSGQSVDLSLLFLASFAALAVIGFGRLARYVMSSD